jgi:hypothetical protein
VNPVNTGMCEMWYVSNGMQVAKHLNTFEHTAKRNNKLSFFADRWFK